MRNYLAPTRSETTHEARSGVAPAAPTIQVSALAGAKRRHGRQLLETASSYIGRPDPYGAEEQCGLLRRQIAISNAAHPSPLAGIGAADGRCPLSTFRV